MHSDALLAHHPRMLVVVENLHRDVLARERIVAAGDERVEFLVLFIHTHPFKAGVELVQQLVKGLVAVKTVHPALLG